MWILLIDIDNFFNTDVTTSLCPHLSPTSIAHNTGNCKLVHDCRRVRSHRRHHATRLRWWQICPDSSRQSPTIANSVYTPDATQLDSWVASMVCIGLYSSNYSSKSSTSCTPVAVQSQLSLNKVVSKITKNKGTTLQAVSHYNNCEKLSWSTLAVILSTQNLYWSLSVTANIDWPTMIDVTWPLLLYTQCR